MLSPKEANRPPRLLAELRGRHLPAGFSGVLPASVWLRGRSPVAGCRYQNPFILFEHSDLNIGDGLAYQEGGRPHRERCRVGP